jgi:hypothetical protein
MTDINDEKYFYAIIRKPQEGKTFICLKNIENEKGCVHLIITMNTIKSNLQFFQRANERFNNNICVFNSRGKKEGKYNHSKDIIGVKNHIKNGIENIIMCAHPRRFDYSILELIDELNDSKSFNKKIMIHIDEAHAYVPPYREQILDMNNYSCVERIYMYTATPFNLWVDEHEMCHDLFKRIHIVDVEEQFGIIRSDKYFGVKDCSHIISVEEPPMIDKVIPDEFVKKWGNNKQRELLASGKTVEWYDENYYFQLGNERHYLSYIKHLLKKLKATRIKEDIFTLNFVPGYCRKITHYAIMKMILEIYPKSVVIVINGEGTNKCIIDNFTDEVEISKIAHNNEPAEQVKSVIEMHPNIPIFITGFHCVGMSVTLINEEIGNFDNVIFSHEQYNKTPDIQYQLCRFLFNYINWKNPEKIKKTKIYSNCSECLEGCLEYEKQIDYIDTTLKGSVRTKEEVIGKVFVKRKEVPKERIFAKLEKYAHVNKLKRFIVSDNEDDIVLEKVKQFYKDFTGKDIDGRAMPKLNEQNFYECSITTGKKIHTNFAETKKILNNLKSTSNFVLSKNKYKYARLYVVYDSNEDPFEYSWIIRTMEIKECEEVLQIWKEIEDQQFRKKNIKQDRIVDIIA